jgi:hypothetical protein
MAATASPRPFTLAVPDDALADLHDRLARTRFSDEPAGAAGAQGLPLAELQRLVARWRDGFDWRAREAAINALPQFTLPVSVDGFGTLDIHFVHQRSDAPGAIPLLFVHGCAYSVALCCECVLNTRRRQGPDTSLRWRRSCRC